MQRVSDLGYGCALSAVISLRLTRMRGRGSRQKLVPTGTDTGLTITSGVVALGSTCATKALGQGW